MKTNTAPYGYKYEMGNIIVDPKECEVVVFIFDLGTKGLSLSQISTMVSKQFPGISFNKCKISRILKDERYVGNEILPEIVSKADFDTANGIKSSMFTKRGLEVKSDVLMINIPFRCPLCHSQMRRYHDDRKRCPERWKCSDNQCCYQIRFSDTDMIDEIKSIMSNLQNLRLDCQEDTIRRSLDTARFENDIRTRIASEDFDVDQLRNDIISLVSLKYTDISNLGARQKRIMEDIRFGNIAEKYVDFINSNALAIDIETDHTITIILADGTKHRRTSTYGSSNVRDGAEGNTYSSNQNIV